MSDKVTEDVRQTGDYVRFFNPPTINGNFHHKHIITVEQFAHQDLDMVFDATRKLRARVRANNRDVLQLGAGRVMATVFYEASTRTDMSFQAAMSRLGGRVVLASNGVQFSSVYKGENLADTVRAVGCYADVVVLRHPQVGSSYEAAHYLNLLAGRLGRQPVLISGGDGIGEHPTQALLDLFTILDYKQQVDDLTITMVGDLRHGRTVHSLAKLLSLYHATNTRFCFVSPPTLTMPSDVQEFIQHKAPGASIYNTSDLSEVIGESDVIYWTRVQEERFKDPADYEAIRDAFIMLPDTLRLAKAEAILMHPLPRKQEMGSPRDHDVLDLDPRAIYFNQMENGMFVRMALLALVMGVKEF